MRKAAGTDFTPGQAQYLQDWVQDKLHRETEMSRVEKLFWRLDRPLHQLAYVVFFFALGLMGIWVLQAGRAGGW